MLFDYIHYRFKSKNEHGVHSPFVYDLLTTVIYNNTEYYAYKEVEDLRLELSRSNAVLNCVDLGAGSYLGKTNVRTIKQLLRYSVKPPKYSKLMFRLVDRFQPKELLELGTSLGITSAYLSKANPSSHLFTIEGCTEIATVARENFEKLNLQNITQMEGEFDTCLPEVLNKIKQLDFVFFDGNHRKQATLNYFNACLPKAHDSSVFVFDDIYWSTEMKQAWTEIKTNPKVSVTIDLFFMGLVFFRKDQTKEHFVLKF